MISEHMARRFVALIYEGAPKSMVECYIFETARYSTTGYQWEALEESYRLAIQVSIDVKNDKLRAYLVGRREEFRMLRYSVIKDMQ